MELIWIILIAQNIWTYIFIFVKPIKIERTVINKIDKFYFMEKNYLTPSRKWYRGSALKEMAYLLEEYKKLLKFIKLNEIESIRFRSVFDNTEDNVVYAKR